MPETMTPQAAGSVAYVLKAFPRSSELFILSEIYRVEQAGVPLRLFAIKPAEPADREPRHEVVDRIQAPCEFLRRSAGLSHSSLASWLWHRLPDFIPPLARTLWGEPVGFCRALIAVLRQSWQTMARGGAGESRVYAKEFLLAVDLADRLRRSPEVRHIHAHYAHAATTIAWLASIITGLPYSFTGHARDIYCEELNPAGLLALKLNAARFTVTCTEANRRHLLGLAPRANVHRLYHGINADFVSLLAVQAGREQTPARLKVLGVGRLVAKKGFDTLIHAIGILRDQGVDAELVLAGGEGDAAPGLRTHITRLGLEKHVQLPGVLSQPELYHHYKSATVFCLPCRVLDDGDRDGIPNVLVEAMAAGLPVVTTPVSGIPELVVDQETGLLVPPDDAAALANALLQVHQSPAVADRLSRAGQAAVQDGFDGDRLAGQLASLLTGAAA